MLLSRTAVLRKYIIIPLLLIASVFVINFGKYKVQYKSFNWSFISTPHYELYFNRHQEKLGRLTADIITKIHALLSDALGIELTFPVPVIIYNSHNDFEQTNITRDLIGEGTGGFTDSLRTRVVLPFTGSYADYWHILQHELTHAMQFAVILGNGIDKILPVQGFMPPLYFIEGMAEYESLGYNTECDMYMRDATINGFNPSLSDLSAFRINNAYMIYKGGQAFCQYIADNYGDDTIGQLLKDSVITRDFDTSIQNVLTISREDLSDKWQRYLRKKYWPMIETLHEPQELYTQLTYHRTGFYEIGDGSFMNLQPSISPNSKYLALITDRHEYPEIILINPKTGHDIRTVIKGHRKYLFEELNRLNNELAWSPDSQWLVFISKNGANDQINLYSIKKKRVKKRFGFNMDTIRYPTVSPDGESICFVGVKDGQSDLYTCSWNGHHLKQLTDNLEYEQTPYYSRNGKYIYFSGNTFSGYTSFNYDILRLNIDDPSQVERIVTSPGQDLTPALSYDNKYLSYISDKDGIFNLYIVNLETKEEIQLTKVTGGVFDPSWAPNGEYIACSIFNHGGNDIFTIATTNLESQFAPVKEENLVLSNTLYTFDSLMTAAGNLSDLTIKTHHVHMKAESLFFAFGMAVGKSVGMQLMVSGGMSDLLGNHRINGSFLINYYDSTFDPVFDSSYMYLKNRIDYGINVYRYKSYMQSVQRHTAISNYLPNTSGNVDIVETYSSTELTEHLFAIYPFSKFLRFRFQINNQNFAVNHENTVIHFTNHTKTTSDKMLLKTIDLENDNVRTAELKLTFDNTLLGFFHSPLQGYRIQLAYQRSFKLMRNDWFYENAFLDFRGYVRVSRRQTIGLWCFTGHNWGPQSGERELTYGLGAYNPFSIFYSIINFGSYRNREGFFVRGYQDDFNTGRHIFMSKLEYRFPLFDTIIMAWPVNFAIQNIGGVFFWDWGSVWDDTLNWKLSKQVGTSGKYIFEDIKSGLGVGLRIRALNYFIIGLDFATPFDGWSALPLKKWQGIFQINIASSRLF